MYYNFIRQVFLNYCPKSWIYFYKVSYKIPTLNLDHSVILKSHIKSNDIVGFCVLFKYISHTWFLNPYSEYRPNTKTGHKWDAMQDLREREGSMVPTWPCQRTDWVHALFGTVKNRAAFEKDFLLVRLTGQVAIQGLHNAKRGRRLPATPPGPAIREYLVRI